MRRKSYRDNNAEYGILDSSAAHLKKFDVGFRASLDPAFKDEGDKKPPCVQKVQKNVKKSKENSNDRRLSKIELYPEDAVAWNNKGIALRKLRRFDEAVKAFEEAIRLSPSYAHAWLNKGICLDIQGKYEAALLAIDEAIRLDPIISRH